MEKEKSCGCVIIDKNLVLLVKHNAGHWDFPKGHVEYNETEEQTAIREVKEETNIDVEIIPGYRYSIHYSPKENVLKEVIFFIAKKKSDKIMAQESEISEVKWLNIDEAVNQITYNDSKEILKKIQKEYIQKQSANN